MSELKLIVIPDTDEPNAASLFVTGHIGETPYRFLLDTGAGLSQVTEDTALSSLGVVDTDHSSGVFAKSSHDVITVPRITVGPIAKENFSLVRVPADSPTQILVGMDFLKDVCCYFRFDEDRVVIDPPDDTLAGFDFQVLWVDARYHPYVDARFAADVASAVWDTGASITVANMEWIEAHQSHFQEAGTSVGTDATGAQVETPMFVMSGLVIAGHAFAPTRVAGVDLSQVNTRLERPMDLILGYATLRQVNWVFDFPRKRFAIIKKNHG